MGMKKVCSCGYWNEAQQECLYNGIGCIRDEEKKKPTVTQEFVERWLGKLGSGGGGHGYPTFWEALEAMLKEAGVKVVGK